MMVDLLALLTIVTYVIVCPYTKVEESFNMQAIYDHLHYGLNIASYDHLQFPGVVPRTFLGSLLVSIASFPFITILQSLKAEGVFHQMLVRVVLGALSWLSLVRLRRAIQSRFSRRTAQLFMIFSALQFHGCFYASRALPNTFAGIVTALAFASWLEHRPVVALQLLGIATIIFRCDMLILTGSIALTMLGGGEIPFLPTLLTGMLTCLGALAVTVVLDSFFWRHWLWPEGVVLFFNTVENRSSEWGVSTWHWYATSALPKSLTLVLPWIALGVIGAALPSGKKKEKQEDAGSVGKTSLALAFQSLPRTCRQMLYYLAPAILFIALYSYLPHKELRFIMPALPLFTLAGSVAADEWLSLGADSLIFPLSLLSCKKTTETSPKRPPSLVWRLVSLGIQLALLLSWLLMLLYSHTCLLAAQHNYPGGEAIEHFLHHFIRSEASVHMHIDPHHPAPHGVDHSELRLEPTFVHIDNLAATTGVTRFLQERFIHHRQLLPAQMRKTSAHHQTKHQLLPLHYSPHKYLNTLPSDWHRLLQVENEHQHEVTSAILNAKTAESSEIVQNQNQGWVLMEDLLVYSKHENLLDIDKTEFDYLITEDPDEFLQSGQFVLREAIAGFDRMQFTRLGPRPVLKNKLFILENAYPHQYIDE